MVLAMRRAGGIFFVFGILLADGGRTQVSPNGPELQLNETTLGAQQHARVAVGDAQFLAVWDSASSPGSDTSGLSIQGRRYAANGTALGPQFQVNEWTTGNQGYPAVASDGGTNFVVVFESASSYTGDSSAILGQLISLGEGTASLFQVNDYTTNLQRRPAIAMNGSGKFVVVWESAGSPGNDASLFSVQARRYGPGGAAAGPQFQVNTFTTLVQSSASVAIDEDGGFVVTWHSSQHTLDPTGSVHTQRYDSNGNPVWFEELVNNHTTGAQRAPVVAATASGEFVVAWESFGSDGDDGDNYSIQARRINAGGLPTGYQFQVNSFTTAAQRFPGIASDTFGNFVVVWQSDGSAGSDSSGLSIQARQFRPDESAVYPDHQVNTYTTGFQQAPGVDTDSGGNFVAVWSGASGSDGDGVQGQRFDGLFRDGFETNGTTRWSSVHP
jgi:hypothetical protein